MQISLEKNKGNDFIKFLLILLTFLKYLQWYYIKINVFKITYVMWEWTNIIQCWTWSTTKLETNLISLLNFDHPCQFNIDIILAGQLRVECRVIDLTISVMSRLISGEIEWSSSAYLMQPGYVDLCLLRSDLSQRIVLCKPESTLIMTSQWDSPLLIASA